MNQAFSETMLGKSGLCGVVNLILKIKKRSQTFFLAIPTLNHYYTPEARNIQSSTFIFQS